MTKKQGHVVAIVQARMLSTRLPGKVLLQVNGRPILSYQIERLLQAKKIDQIVVATTTRPEDTPIADFCKKEGVAVFCGSEEDVLDRYLQAAVHFNATTVVRITGDCPLIDPMLVDAVIETYQKGSYDYVSNTQIHPYPRGMDTEVFSFNALQIAVAEAKKRSEREHVTLYFYSNPEKFHLGQVKITTPGTKDYRLTVDTEEDFQVIEALIVALYKKQKMFTLEEIVQYLNTHPKIAAINSHIIQKSIEEN